MEHRSKAYGILKNFNTYFATEIDYFFRGERRSIVTHAPTTDPDARPFTRSSGQTAKPCYVGHVPMENRHPLVAGPALSLATGNAEWVFCAKPDNGAWSGWPESGPLPACNLLRIRKVLMAVST